MSTASWAPPHSGRPLAMTSMRRSSWRAGSTFKFLTSTLRATAAPASLHTRAAARSRGPPLARKKPGARAGGEVVSTRVEVCAATASGRGQWQGQAKSAQENGSEEWRLQRELRQGGTGGENARCLRPSLRVQQGGGGSVGFPKEGPVAKVVNGLGRRARVRSRDGSSSSWDGT